MVFVKNVLKLASIVLMANTPYIPHPNVIPTTQAYPNRTKIVPGKDLLSPHDPTAG
jgi:hypothetical protein